MKHVTALYRTTDMAERVRAEIAAAGVADSDIHVVSGTERGHLRDVELTDEERARYEAALDGGDAMVVAHVDDEHAEIAQRIMARPESDENTERLRAEHPEGQLIAPAGKPLGAVGATSTIGAADDGRQAYEDPLEPRD